MPFFHGLSAMGFLRGKAKIFVWRFPWSLLMNRADVCISSCVCKNQGKCLHVGIAWCFFSGFLGGVSRSIKDICG